MFAGRTPLTMPICEFYCPGYPTPGSGTTFSPIILPSTDAGTTWIERTAIAPPGVQQAPCTVAYGNGRFVAFGLGNATRARRWERTHGSLGVMGAVPSVPQGV